MPALTVFGQRLPLIAGDDLRAISKAAGVLRLTQLGLLIPSMILLRQSPAWDVEAWWLLLDSTTSTDSQSTTTVTTNNKNNDTIVLSQQQQLDCLLDDPYTQTRRTILVFWSVSALTVVASMLLELLVFRSSSRGSPVQVEARPHLPCLCAIKLIPLSVVRIVAMLWGTQTLVQVRRFCQPFPDVDTPLRSAACHETLHDIQLCRPGTSAVLSALAWTHVVEMAVLCGILAPLLLRDFGDRRRRVLGWLKMSQWGGSRRLGTACRWSSVCFCWPRRSDGLGGGSSHPSDYTSDRHSWWHGCCRFCCACATCATCCLFGGTEAVSRSKQKTSWLMDISLVLADFFDTGGDDDVLDVTPTDISMGLNLLALEQRKQRRQRFSLLNSSDQEDWPSERGLWNIGNDKQKTLTDADLELGIEPVVASRSFASGIFVDSCDEEDELMDSEGNIIEVGDESEAQRPEQRLYTDVNQKSMRQLHLVRTNSQEQASFRVSIRTKLVRENADDVQVINDGAHYIRLAVAVYGHMLYVLHNACSAPCCLLAGLASCRCILNKRSGPVVVGDNLCGWNQVGFLRVAGYEEDDLVYVSFISSLEMTPYAIVVDKEKKTIVVVVRGTFSLEATAADLNIRPELLADYKEDCEAFGDEAAKGECCHSGILKCSIWLFKDLARHKTLDSLLVGPDARYSDFTLVCTGHSLGGGIASVLAFMLRPMYPQLRCLCFAPPGCVLSDGAAAQDYTTSYVLNSDVVPRLSLHSVVGLRNDVLDMIARVRVPKHTTLRKELFDPFNSQQEISTERASDVVCSRSDIPKSKFYSQVCDFHEHQRNKASKNGDVNVQLRLPGRVVHLLKSPIAPTGSTSFGRLRRVAFAFTPVWSDRSTFGEIQLSRRLLLDHEPQGYHSCLRAIADEFAKVG